MMLLTKNKLRLSDSLDEIDGVERRRGLRIGQAFPVKVLDKRCGKYFGGQTRDISESGLQIELPGQTPVRSGEMLSIYVERSAAGLTLANRRQMVSARVVWVRRADSLRRMTMVGVEFAAINGAAIGAQLEAA